MSPVDACLGPRSGMPPAGVRAPVVPTGVSGPDPASGRLPKGFSNVRGGGGLLGVVYARPLVSKAGSGCVWEAGL